MAETFAPLIDKGKMKERKMTTVLLVDDHRLLRDGLHVLLGAEPDFQVVGEAGGGFEAIALTRRLRPDVLVLDLVMDDMNGIQVARQVLKDLPETTVVMLSMYGSEAYVLEALRAGAKAYILKDAAAECLVHGIREALDGRRYLSPPISQQSVDAYQDKLESPETNP